ncbi:hypothetical protein I4F81_011973 [Pyropia yezoensis]|uniref:Uncharacterized protein n=1 Tax=Pyropia yezoensis TaxID=2788 RepID=A0ACC3CH17_PYRYE|nr:hypothetical protein I4F81_011973 [Neopyropia yezoensis]
MAESLGDVASSLAALGFGSHSAVLCAARVLHYSAQLLYDAGCGDLVVAVVVGKRDSTNGVLLYGGPPRSVSVGPSLMANLSTSVRLMLSSLRAIASCPERAPPAHQLLDTFSQRTPHSPTPAAPAAPLRPSWVPPNDDDGSWNEDNPSGALSLPASPSLPASTPSGIVPGPTALRPPLPSSGGVPPSAVAPSLGIAGAGAGRGGSAASAASGDLAESAGRGELVAGAMRRGLAAGRGRGVSADVVDGDQQNLSSPSMVLDTVPGLLDIPDMIGSAAEEAKLTLRPLNQIFIPDDVTSSVLRQLRTYYDSDKWLLRRWAPLLKHACTLLIAKKTAPGKKAITIGSYRSMTPKVCFNAIVTFTDGLCKRVAERPMLDKTSHVNETAYFAVILVMAYQEQTFYLWLIEQFAHGAVCATGRKRKAPLLAAGEDAAAGAVEGSGPSRGGAAAAERGDPARGGCGTEGRGGSVSGGAGAEEAGRLAHVAADATRGGGPACGGSAAVGGDHQARGSSATGGGDDQARGGSTPGGGEDPERGGSGAERGGGRASEAGRDGVGGAPSGAAAGEAAVVPPSSVAQAVNSRRSCAQLMREQCVSATIYNSPSMELLLRDHKAVAVGLCDPSATCAPDGYELGNTDVFVHGGAEVVRGCGGLAYPGNCSDSSSQRRTLQAVCVSPFTWELSHIACTTLPSAGHGTCVATCPPVCH